MLGWAEPVGIRHVGEPAQQGFDPRHVVPVCRDRELDLGRLPRGAVLAEQPDRERARERLGSVVRDVKVEPVEALVHEPDRGRLQGRREGEGGRLRSAHVIEQPPARPGDEVSEPEHDATAAAGVRASPLPEDVGHHLAGDSLRDAASLIGRLRDSVMLAPRTPFNVHIGTQRSFAVASLPLDTVKRVARHFGASLNDVVLALCASTLREYLQRRRLLPKKSLIAAMPVSLRAAGDGAANNQVSMVQCELPTALADPVERLRAISAATGQLKRQVASVRGLIPTDFPGFAAPIWATGLSRLWGSGTIAERLPQLANLVVSNVPGPPVPLYLAGVKVLHSYPVSIVTHGLGLNITVNSYAGSLEFGLLAARDVAPKLDALAGGLARALAALDKQVDK